ncbi:MAG: UbiA family prenyltransferase [Alphaproteobacteria bacterium]|nr:UbiA family prenyltransferase [Alphaproteobacteria bacterium]
MQQSVAVRRASPTPPLVVDLDGTLVKIDLLAQSFFGLLAARPIRALATLAALLHGKAAFKAALAGQADLDCATLPFNPELLAFIRAEHAKGRAVYLASAADRRLVEAVADALGLFAGTFASDGTTNLAGAAKAQVLCDAFGIGGFDYAGNARVDFAVWEKARGVWLAGAGTRLQRRVVARFPEARIVDPARRQWSDYLRTLRVHQWLKNLLIFVPAATAHRFMPMTAMALVLAFLSFSLCASSAYIANDLLDLGNDRAHLRKRDRPLASGRVPLGHALALVPVLLALATTLAWSLPHDFLALLAGYYVLTMSYSLVLKRKVMIDVVTLACLYGMRLAAGAVAVAVPLSPWFVAFSVFFFLCLALVKRCTEITDRIAKDAGDPKGRGYIQRDLPMLEAMAAGTGYVAIMIFALYIDSPAVAALYRSPEYLWAICLVLFYWISRVLLLTHRGEMHDDPVVFAATDLKSLVCGALILVIGAFSI